MLCVLEPLQSVSQWDLSLFTESPRQVRGSAAREEEEESSDIPCSRLRLGILPQLQEESV